MKKNTLLAGTALVAVSLASGTAYAAEPLQVRVGGFMNQWFGYQDNDDSRAASVNGTLQGDVQDFEQWSNTEIIFSGTTKLDVGLEVGIQVQLEGNTSGDTIDESFAFLEGTFGRLVIGSENDAAYLMTVAAPNVGLPLNSGSQTQHIINPTGASFFRTAFGSTFVTPGNDNDGQKITYFTPRFSGFQFGVSYLPDIDPTGGDRNSLTSEQSDYTNGFSVGANYSASYDDLGVDVAASVGYGFASAPEDAFTVLGDAVDDHQHFVVGASIGWNGFTLGGSYADIFEGTISNGGQDSTEGDGFDIGVSYETGPIGVSLTYFHGEQEDNIAVSGEDENDSFAGSVNYALGAGVSVIGTVGYSDFEGEFADESDDNDGFYVTTGLALRF